MISYDLFQGDSYDTLKNLSSRTEERNKYRLIITSPPYYNHRHYGEDPREIGQEHTSGLFIDRLVDIFAGIC